MKAWLLAAVLVLAGCGSSGIPPETTLRNSSPPPSGSPPAGALTLPNPALTPGTTNPGVTQATISATICVKGWTATVRPPVSVTNVIKQDRMRAYGYAITDIGLYELDHLIPLELGGGTADVANLWPQAWDGLVGAHIKDKVENETKARVCAGKMTLADAQQQISKDWIALGKSEGLVS